MYTEPEHIHPDPLRGGHPVNLDRLGLIFKPLTPAQSHILTRLSHALPCITLPDERRVFTDPEEAELYRETAEAEGVPFLGYFNPLTA